MPTLISNHQIPESQDFRVQIIKDDNTIWLRLSSTDLDKFYGFWSSNNTDDQITVDQVIEELSIRLKKCNKDCGEFEIKDATEFYPTGWEYWSFGLPAPISDYLTYDFKNELGEHKNI